MTDADGADWPPERTLSTSKSIMTDLEFLPPYTLKVKSLQWSEVLDQFTRKVTPQVQNADSIVQDKLRQKALDAEVELKLRYVEDFGPDTYDEATVVRFTKSYDGSSTPYMYAAIKIAGSWYTTGPRGNRYTWNEFIAWLVSGDKPTLQFQLMTIFE